MSEVQNKTVASTDEQLPADFLRLTDANIGKGQSVLGWLIRIVLRLHRHRDRKQGAAQRCIPTDHKRFEHLQPIPKQSITTIQTPDFTSLFEKIDLNKWAVGLQPQMPL